MIDIREQIAKIDAQLYGLLIERRIFEQALGEKVKAPFKRVFGPDECDCEGHSVAVWSYDARLTDPWFCYFQTGADDYLIDRKGNRYDLRVEDWEWVE